MHDEKHDLVHELPEFKDKIHELKTSNNHFARLFDEYHVLTKEIHHLEAANVPTSDAHIEDLKKKRLFKKDELYNVLRAA